MSRDEIESEQSNEILNLAKMILEFTNQNQKEKGLKILTQDQMISRLLFTLTHLKAENNLEKLFKKRNKVTIVLIISLKTITKAIFNNLINTI